MYYDLHIVPANELHVMPVDDSIEHGFNECPCGPKPSPIKRKDGSIGWISTHHSLDGRELVEQREKDMIAFDKNYCPIWGSEGHNWRSLRGTFLWWRRYRVCIACNYLDRVHNK